MSYLYSALSIAEINDFKWQLQDLSRKLNEQLVQLLALNTEPIAETSDFLRLTYDELAAKKGTMGALLKTAKA